MSKQSEYKKRMRRLGLCVDCGMPAGGARCWYHLEVQAKKARERRQRSGKTAKLL